MTEVAGCEDYVRRAEPWLLRLAYLVTGSAADASDLTQETLARVYLAWPKVAAAANRDAYVRKVMINAERRMHRRRRVTEVLGVPDRPSRDALPEVDDRLAVAAALGVLPRRQRAVVVLRYLEDLAEADVAALLNCSSGTVKSQASKALAKLRLSTSLAEVMEQRSDG